MIETVRKQIEADIIECKNAISSHNNKDTYTKMKVRYMQLDANFLKGMPNYIHTVGSSYSDELKAVITTLETYLMCDSIPINQDNLISNNNIANEPLIFLSHCSDNKNYGNALRDFIVGLGVKDNQLVYTSHPNHKIPLDSDIFDYLRNKFTSNVFVIILWSQEYLESPACLNEMGAAWVTKSDYSNVYVPDFDFNDSKYHACAVDTNKMGISLKIDDKIKISMLELKNKIVNLFRLQIDEGKTQYLLDNFIATLNKIKEDDDWVCQTI